MASVLTQLTASFALLVCLAVSTWACCTPDQWEGYQPAVGGYSKEGYKVHKSQGSFDGFSHVVYDYTNKRKAVFMTVISGEYQNNFHIIQRCGDKGEEGCRTYVLDLKKQTCFTKKSCCEFRKACIPKDAKVLGKGFLGLQGVFPITGYQVKKESMTVDVTVTNLDADVCIPVAEVVLGERKNVHFMQTLSFIDITPGIKNSTVFEIPKECKEDPNVSLDMEFEREHYVMAV